MLLVATALGSIVLGRIGVVPEARAIAAATGAVSLAPALGSVIRLWWSWDIGPELALRFGLGTLLIVAVALAANVVGVFSITLVSWVSVVALMVALVFCGWRLRNGRAPKVRCDGNGLIPSVVGAAAGIAGATAAAVYWRSRSPLPYQSTWDGLLHLSIIERMLVDNRFSLSLRSLSPAFSFDAYLPGFHLNLGIASRLTGVPVLNELWAGTFVLTAVAGGGIFVLTRRTWSSTAAATGAAIVSGLFMTTRKSTNPLIALLPASEVMAVAPFALLVLACPDRGQRLRRGLALSLVLCAVHTLMGLLLLAVIVASDLVATAVESRRRWLRLGAATVVAVSVLVAGVLLGFAAALRPHVPLAAFDPTSFYASLTTAVDLRSRLGLVSVSFPHLLPGLLAVVAGLALVWHRRSAAGAALRAVPVVIFVGFAVPIAGSERLEGFLFIAMTLAVGAALAEIESLVGRCSPSPSRVSRWAGGAAAVLIAFGAIPILAQPLAVFRQFQRADTSDPELQSSFAPYELTGIPEFSQHEGRGRVVVSDPITQELAEGFGRMDSVGGRGMPAELHRQIIDALLAPSARVARERLTALQSRFGSFVLIVSGRTERWAVLNERGLRAGTLTLEQLRFSAIFRPWDFSDLPDRVINRTKDDLLRVIRASSCVADEDDRGEIVAFVIDCPGAAQ